MVLSRLSLMAQRRKNIMQRHHKEHGASTPHTPSPESDRSPFNASASQRRPDADIRREIHKRLNEDPLLDASGIFVSVSNGRVLVEGSVTNDEAKRRAEGHSRQVNGISGHDSNLSIRKPR
jgi:osmotically-inducible protein OsmY